MESESKVSIIEVARELQEKNKRKLVEFLNTEEELDTLTKKLRKVFEMHLRSEE